MDSYIEIVFNSLEWLDGRLEAVLVVPAALCLAWLTIPPRRLSLVAVAFIAGGIALVYRGVDELTVAVLLIGSSSVLLAIEASSMRKRLGQLEQSLASTAQVVRALEVAQERQQAFSARRMLPGPGAASPDERRPDLGADVSREVVPQSVSPPTRVGRYK